MEDKKILKDKELEKVVGGTGNESDVRRAFTNALIDFRTVKTADDKSVAPTSLSPTNDDSGIIANMIMECESFLSGKLDAKTALYYLQGLYDSLNNKERVQRAMDNLKTAVG